MKGKAEKIKKYVKDDRPQRLKSFIRKHGLVLSSLTLNHGRNLIHYCCKHGSGMILRYLLAEGVCAVTQDDQQQCPLHIALGRALQLEEERQYEATADCYGELILPLLQQFPQCLDMKDVQGRSCRQMLHELVCQRETASHLHSQDLSDSSEEPGDLNEQEWRDKLADEHQHEYNTTWGNYEPDYSWTEREEETYDDWADRIRKEYRAKKHAQERAAYSTHKKRTKHSEHEERSENSKKRTKHNKKETLEEARERMRKQFDSTAGRDTTVDILKTRMKYETRYKTVLDNIHSQELKYSDVPWPSVKGENLDISVLFDNMDRESEEYRKYLRDQQVRWHPDKFLQRFGSHLVHSDRERIMARVTLLSQSLNKLKS